MCRALEWLLKIAFKHFIVLPNCSIFNTWSFKSIFSFNNNLFSLPALYTCMNELWELIISHDIKTAFTSWFLLYPLIFCIYRYMNIGVGQICNWCSSILYIGISMCGVFQCGYTNIYYGYCALSPSWWLDLIQNILEII